MMRRELHRRTEIRQSGVCRAQRRMGLASVSPKVPTMRIQLNRLRELCQRLRVHPTSQVTLAPGMPDERVRWIELCPLGEIRVSLLVLIQVAVHGSSLCVSI